MQCLLDRANAAEQACFSSCWQQHSDGVAAYPSMRPLAEARFGCKYVACGAECGLTLQPQSNGVGGSRPAEVI